MKTKTLITTTVGLALLLAAQSAFAFSSFRARIPNGTLLASPASCINCHDADGPPLNSFGDAFVNANSSWTVALAAMDSDGDGFSNGRELGDSAGSWVEGNPNPPGPVFYPGDAASHPTAGTSPTITSAAPPAAGTVGAAYNFTVTATGTAPITFTAPGLPGGLAISGAGMISGTPTTAGTFNGTTTAANGTLPNATQAFSIVIGAATRPIIQSPSLNGTDLTLRVDSQAGLNYVLEATPLLVPATWTGIQTNAGGGSLTFTVPINPATANMSFRIRVQ